MAVVAEQELPPRLPASEPATWSVRARVPIIAAHRALVRLPIGTVELSWIFTTKSLWDRLPESSGPGWTAWRLGPFVMAIRLAAWIG